MPEKSFEFEAFLSEKGLKSVMVSMHPKLPDSVKRHPEPISLGLGEPNSNSQPIKSLDVKFNSFKSWKITHIPKYALKDQSIVSMSQSLRYAEASGLPGLWTQVEKFVTEVGNEPAYKNWGLHPTFGRTNGFNTIANALLNPGDSVLIPEFLPEDLKDVLRSHQANSIVLKTDLQNGLDLNELLTILQSLQEKGEPLPKFLYTVPAGAPPNGVTQSLDLRKKVYQLCEQFNLLIVEDDPYGYISLQNFDPNSEKSYLQTLIPSYLTIDPVGRVLRTETFATTLLPGLGLGFVVAHKSLIGPIYSLSEIVNDAPSGVSQAIVGHALPSLGGYISWLMQLSLKYQEREKIVQEALLSKNTSGKSHNSIKLIEPSFGVFVGIELSGDAELIKQRCWDEQGLKISLSKSGGQEKEFVQIFLFEGSNSEFKEAIERLVAVLES